MNEALEELQNAAAKALQDLARFCNSYDVVGAISLKPPVKSSDTGEDLMEKIVDSMNADGFVFNPADVNSVETYMNELKKRTIETVDLPTWSVPNWNYLPAETLEYRPNEGFMFPSMWNSSSIGC